MRKTCIKHGANHGGRNVLRDDWSHGKDKEYDGKDVMPENSPSMGPRIWQSKISNCWLDYCLVPWFDVFFLWLAHRARILMMKISVILEFRTWACEIRNSGASWSYPSFDVESIIRPCMGWPLVLTAALFTIHKDQACPDWVTPCVKRCSFRIKSLNRTYVWEGRGPPPGPCPDGRPTLMADFGTSSGGAGW